MVQKLWQAMLLAGCAIAPALAASGPAIAQGADEMRRCAVLNDDRARLDCFDRLAQRTIAPATPSGTPAERSAPGAPRSPEPIAPAQQAVAPDKAFEITVAPRFYATVVSVDDARVDPIFTPMGGMTIGARLGRFPNWDLAVTGLYGKGDSDFRDKDEDTRGDARFSRTDFEALLRYRIPDTSLYVFFGPRYVRGRQALDHSGTNGRERYVTHLYMAEVGGGFAHSIDDAGRHSVFANITAGVGHSRTSARTNLVGYPVYNSDGAAFLGDLNIGYQYAFNSFFTLSGRYRLINVHIDNQAEEKIGRNIVQGIEFAGTFRF
ncbi:MAG: hypothetical protein KIT20_14585 [Alphaproteobacteria bacterium]|nr:hypothetical protein [Alphaproteobacteria bacterium]